VGDTPAGAVPAFCMLHMACYLICKCWIPDIGTKVAIRCVLRVVVFKSDPIKSSDSHRDTHRIPRVHISVAIKIRLHEAISTCKLAPAAIMRSGSLAGRTAQHDKHAIR